MKRIIKAILPESAMGRLKNSQWYVDRQRDKVAKETMRMSKAEDRRFADYCALPVSTEREQIEAQLIFYTHQLEKGFSFDEYQYGHGHAALRSIATLLHRLAKADPEFRENPVVLETLQALGEYRRRHTEAGKDTAFLDSLFPAAMNERIREESRRPYPTTDMPLSGKAGNATASFADLAERRHSVRSFSSQPVTRAEIEEAIEGALRTPSVCNRQPTRVRMFLDPDVIAKALKIQGGFGGYPTPPALLAVTGDLQAFLFSNEHNEAYTDGGLFAMSLLYSLEAHTLAACPLNTMFRPDQERETRELLDIPDNEVFVMYIAVGHFKEVSRTCLSKRLPLGHVLRN